MLKAVTAIRFDKALTSGKTKPGIFTCRTAEGEEVELVVKFGAACEGKERALLNEALAAVFAADLDLPVPEPFLVYVEEDLAKSIPDEAIRQHALKSIGWNFGSAKLPPGFFSIPKGWEIPNDLRTHAADILAFDVCIGNDDRTVDNPNCLSDGRRIAIFDHELAFLCLGGGVIGWKPPWETGAVKLPRSAPPRHRHVFLDTLHPEDANYERFLEAMNQIATDRFVEYGAHIPHEWKTNPEAVDDILLYLAQLKDKASDVTKEIREAIR
jgi:hypothetical protein